MISSVKFSRITARYSKQPVPEKTRLEMAIGMEIRILNVQFLGLFSNRTFEKRPGTIMHDSDFHSDYHIESNLFRNELYMVRWQRPLKCLIFVGHFPQKSPLIIGCFAETDMRLRHPMTLRHPIQPIPYEMSLSKKLKAQARGFFFTKMWRKRLMSLGFEHAKQLQKMTPHAGCDVPLSALQHTPFICGV